MIASLVSSHRVDVAVLVGLFVVGVLAWIRMLYRIFRDGRV